MLRYLSTLFLLLCMSAAFAKGSCQTTAEQDSKGYNRATRQVQRLPDFKSWQKKQTFPVAFLSSVDKELLIEGKCYWMVTVYLNEPERVERWQSFYVRQSDQRILVDDNSGGDPITLSEWRKHQR